MTDHPGGRLRALAFQDACFLAEARSLVELRRFKSQTAALDHLAELRGISNERERKSLIERCRQRAIRQQQVSI